MIEYKRLLEHSFSVTKEDSEICEISRLEYLSDHVFGFTTYDSEISELFAEKAVECCAAITNGSTLEYIKDVGNYKWYLLMCNTSFFNGRLEWGTSIRGAYWSLGLEGDMELKSCGIWEDGKQILSMRFSLPEWDSFIRRIIEFAAPEMED